MAHGVADLIDRTQIFVLYLGLDLGLAKESLDLVRIVAAKKLESHESAEAGIARLENIAHTAAADEVDELVSIPARNREDFERISSRQLGFVAGVRG